MSAEPIAGGCTAGNALADLANLPRWVAWRTEIRGDKPTKVPYCAFTGGRAKADDPSTWAPRSEAEARARKITNGHGGGVGVQLGDLGDGLYLCGIDLDSCLDDDVLADWAAVIIEAAPTYGERSPSGKGIKLIFYAATEDVRPFLDRIGVEPGKWGCRRDAPGKDGRDHGPAIEVYAAARYFAVTDSRWPGTPSRLAPLDRNQLDRLAELIPPPKKSDGRGDLSGDNSRSAVALRKTIALRRAGATFEQVCAALRADSVTGSWVREKGEAAGGRELQRLWDKVDAILEERHTDGVSLDDFWAYMPMHNYIFAPGRATWPAASVNARIPPVPVIDDDGVPVLNDKGEAIRLSAAAWLDRFKPIEQMTWAPGEPTIIRDRLMFEGGLIERSGCGCFNLYQPPAAKLGDPTAAGKWIDHVRLVYPENAEHIFDWLAHRVQHPAQKVNHSLVLGGEQGIGKDSLLAPAKYAVGPWNFQEVSPSQVIGRFNGFLRSVILRINEARDLGDSDRFKFYDHMKAYTASPPETLRVDEKNLREYSILNCSGIIITTNHKDALYLPADDRRNYVAWSALTKEHQDFAGGAYWKGLWSWYENGGFENVAAWLHDRDISGFDPKAPPPKTPAFWAIVDSNRAPEEPELADLIEVLKTPDALTLAILRDTASKLHCYGIGDWLADRANRRTVPHRLERCGYAPVRNPDANDGLWKIDGRRQAIYGRHSLALSVQVEAAGRLVAAAKASDGRGCPPLDRPGW